MPNFKKFKQKNQAKQKTEEPPVQIKVVNATGEESSQDQSDEDELLDTKNNSQNKSIEDGDNDNMLGVKPDGKEVVAPKTPSSHYFNVLNKALNDKKTGSSVLLSDDEDDESSKLKSNGRVKFPITLFSSPSTLQMIPPGEGAKRPFITVQRAQSKQTGGNKRSAKPRGPVKKRRFVVDDDEESEVSVTDSDSASETDSDGSDDSTEVTSARTLRAEKRLNRVVQNGGEKKKSKLKKAKRRRFLDSDEDELGAAQSSSEEEEYEEKDRLESSSEDDGDDGDKPVKVSKKKKLVKSAEQISFESEARKTLRTRVVTFMNEATIQELTTVQTISKRKADEILKLRPFEDYQDLRDKIDSSKVFNYDTFDKVLDAVKSRDDVKALMFQCESLSQSIKQLVDSVKPASQPKLLNKKCTLMDYQLIGLNWLALMHKQGINAILADEMGLGKTIQVISFLAYLKETCNIPGPHLIVVPASTLDNWDREFSTWAPKMNLLVYHGSMDDRLELRDKMDRKKFKFDVMLTTYNMIFAKDDAKFMKRQSFKYIVFDEAHLLKNMKTLKYDKLLRLKSKHRLMLTGTPLQNNLLELMSLLVFTMPNLFLPKLNSVKALFSSNNFSTVFTAPVSGHDYVSPFERERIDHAKNMLHPFILRRLKANVLKNLPKKTIIIEKVPMSESQRKVYEALIASYKKRASLDDSVTSIDLDEVEKENASSSQPEKAKDVRNKKAQNEPEEIGYRKGASVLMSLRKAANHPLLVRHHYQDKKLTQMSQLMLKEPTHRDASAKFIKEDMELLTDHELHSLCTKYNSISKFKLPNNRLLDSGKLAFFDKILPELFEKGEKVLIFSQFCITLDIIEFYMKERAYPYLRLDGSTKIHERLDLIDDFNNDKDKDNDQTIIDLEAIEAAKNDDENEEEGDDDEIQVIEPNGKEQEKDEDDEEQEEEDDENSRSSRSSRASKASSKASSNSNSLTQGKRIFAFLLTTKAGGVGINLTAATTAIIHDIDFNPFNDKQAEDRCHRLGQTRDVTIYKLISEGTVEEGILSLAEKKMKLGEDIQGSNDTPGSPIKSQSNGRESKAAKNARSKDMQTLLKRTLGISV